MVSPSAAALMQGPSPMLYWMSSTSRTKGAVATMVSPRLSSISVSPAPSAPGIARTANSATWVRICSRVSCPVASRDNDVMLARRSISSSPHVRQGRCRARRIGGVVRTGCGGRQHCPRRRCLSPDADSPMKRTGACEPPRATMSAATGRRRRSWPGAGLTIDASDHAARLDTRSGTGRRARRPAVRYLHPHRRMSCGARAPVRSTGRGSRRPHRPWPATVVS